MPNHANAGNNVKSRSNSTTASSAHAAGVAPRFRQRKISLKQQLRVLYQKNLPNYIEDVRGDLLGIIETGVDKSEEDERHLQAVLQSTSTGNKNANTYIPTPKASTKWEEYPQFYTPGWIQTESYLRSSATVEDATGNEYCMDEDDAEFLTKMNANINDDISDDENDDDDSNDDDENKNENENKNKKKCTEDEFELIVTLMEEIVSEKQPFLATTPESLMSYDEMEKCMIKFMSAREEDMKNPLNPERLLRETDTPDFALKYEGCSFRTPMETIKKFSNQIYQHWRERKIKAGGKSLQPTLHYETGLPTDDSDPYVCFRRREVRHSRKTRRTDQQNDAILRKLHSEMHKGLDLMAMVSKRENTRLDHIVLEKELFQARCRYKQLKRKLDIGSESDDLELLVSVPKRVRQEEQARLRRQERDRERREKALMEKQRQEREKKEAKQQDLKLAEKKAAAGSAAGETTTAGGSRLPELQHITIEQQMQEVQRNLQDAIFTKMLERKKQDAGWVNASESLEVPPVNYFQVVPNAPYNNTSKVGSQQTNDLLRFSSIELSNSKRAADLMNMPRMELAGRSEDIDMLISDEKGNVKTKSTVDFAWDPTSFSVPKPNPQAITRVLKYGTTFIDRVLPSNQNPMSKFAENLKQSKNEADQRLADRYKYADAEDPELDLDLWLYDDPARLNKVKPETQNIRFGSVLTSKACDLLAEAQNQRRKALHNMAKRQHMQNLQSLQQQQAKKQNQAQMRSQYAATRARALAKGKGKGKGKSQGQSQGKGKGKGKTSGPVNRPISGSVSGPVSGSVSGSVSGAISKNSAISKGGKGKGKGKGKSNKAALSRPLHGPSSESVRPSTTSSTSSTTAPATAKPAPHHPPHASNTPNGSSANFSRLPSHSNVNIAHTPNILNKQTQAAILSKMSEEKKGGIGLPPGVTPTLPNNVREVSKSEKSLNEKSLNEKSLNDSLKQKSESSSESSSSSESANESTNESTNESPTGSPTNSRTGSPTGSPKGSSNSNSASHDNNRLPSPSSPTQENSSPQQSKSSSNKQQEKDAGEADELSRSRSDSIDGNSRNHDSPLTPKMHRIEAGV